MGLTFRNARRRCSLCSCIVPGVRNATKRKTVGLLYRLTRSANVYPDKVADTRFVAMKTRKHLFFVSLIGLSETRFILPALTNGVHVVIFEISAVSFQSTARSGKTQLRNFAQVDTRTTPSGMEERLNGRGGESSRSRWGWHRTAKELVTFCISPPSR